MGVGCSVASSSAEYEVDSSSHNTHVELVNVARGNDAGRPSAPRYRAAVSTATAPVPAMVRNRRNSVVVSVGSAAVRSHA